MFHNFDTTRTQHGGEYLRLIIINNGYLLSAPGFYFKWIKKIFLSNIHIQEKYIAGKINFPVLKKSQFCNGGVRGLNKQETFRENY